MRLLFVFNTVTWLKHSMEVFHLRKRLYLLVEIVLLILLVKWQIQQINTIVENLVDKLLQVEHCSGKSFKNIMVDLSIFNIYILSLRTYFEFFFTPDSLKCLWNQSLLTCFLTSLQRKYNRTYSFFNRIVLFFWLASAHAWLPLCYNEKVFFLLSVCQS